MGGPILAVNRVRESSSQPRDQKSSWRDFSEVRGVSGEGFFRVFKVFRGFQRFSEALSETLSEADSLSEALGPVAPIPVAP